MIQDIAPHHYINAYRPDETPDAESYALYFENHTALIIRNGETGFDYPRFKDLENYNDDIYSNYTYLFSIDNEKFFLLDHITVPAPSQFTMENTLFFRIGKPGHLAFAGITGYHLFNWYNSHRYCGRCGAPMRHDKKERMMFCENCKQMDFPKISPAVIIGVTNGSKLLLSKYNGRTYKKYALLAGFTEIGETLEETVKREVMEEVGLKVTNVRYYKNQPWSFSDSLLVGFFCDLAEPGAIRIDKNELSLAKWCEREELPLDDDEHISLTHEMIRYFHDHETV